MAIEFQGNRLPAELWIQLVLPYLDLGAMQALCSTNKYFNTMLKQLLPNKPAWRLHYNMSHARGLDPLFRCSHASFLLAYFPYTSPDTLLVPFIKRSCTAEVARLTAHIRKANIQLSRELALEAILASLQHLSGNTFASLHTLGLSHDIMFEGLYNGLPYALASKASDDAKLSLLFLDVVCKFELQTIGRCIQVAAGTSGPPVMQALLERSRFTINDFHVPEHVLYLELALRLASHCGKFDTLRWMFNTWLPSDDASGLAMAALEPLVCKPQASFKRKHLKCYLFLKDKADVSDDVLEASVAHVRQVKQRVLEAYPIQVSACMPE